MSARRDPGPFQFRTATQDHGNLAQLQEWANHYGVHLTWGDSSEQVGGVTTHYSYPIIQGHVYTNFECSGHNQRTAREFAADAIVGSPGVLDQARSRLHPSVPLANLGVVSAGWSRI